MNIGVLGTGTVGQTLASAFAERGHQVRMGSREAGNERAVEWAREAGDGASEGSFADAAAFGELVVNATAGTASIEALRGAGAENLAGKVLLDVANPLDFSQGFPPRLSVCNDDSLAEQIQRELPDARVVKSLNTMTAAVMVAPDSVPRPHNVFVCGDDADAKTTVADLLGELGWNAEEILDLGGIDAARGTEMYLPFWLRLMGTGDGPIFNLRVVRPE